MYKPLLYEILCLPLHHLFNNLIFFDMNKTPSRCNSMFPTSKVTLGIRNNNPLNIRYSPVNNWLGQTGCNRGFCTFSSMEYGFRAALVLLRNYVRRGLNTPRTIISNWAPASENDTEAYIRNAPYPWSSDYRLSTMSDLCILCLAMSYIESGYAGFDSYDLLEIVRNYNIKL